MQNMGIIVPLSDMKTMSRNNENNTSYYIRREEKMLLSYETSIQYRSTTQYGAAML